MIKFCGVRFRPHKTSQLRCLFYLCRVIDTYTLKKGVQNIGHPLSYEKFVLMFYLLKTISKNLSVAPWLRAV